jgi:uncharacterized membrane protein YedE/YeeE
VKSVLAALGAGALFGAGLVVSGMGKPAKVLGFLDVAGRWDPTLGFVMAGALLVYIVLFRVIMRRGSPLLDVKFHLPARKDIDARLVAGAALFGVGWGLAGYCPGPALVALGAGLLPALVFVAAMIAGMWLETLVPAAAARGERDVQRDVPRQA